MSEATFEAIKRYLTPREAAAYMGRGVSTLAIDRMKGIGVPYIKFSNTIRYDLNDLQEFMAERRVTPEQRPTAEKRRVGRPRKFQGKDVKVRGN